MTQSLAYGTEGNRQYDLFYRHSGKVTLLGAITAGVAGVAGAVVAGIAYAYIDLYSPIIYLNLAVCAGFGAALGFIVARTLQWGKVRNLPVALAIVGVVTLAGYYICWVFWIGAVINRFEPDAEIDRLQFAMHPKAICMIAGRINEVGTFNIGSSSSSSKGKENITGVPLYGMWIGEAALIFGTAIFVAKKMVSDKPFCERCDRWCDGSLQLLTLGGHNLPLVVSSMREHNFEALHQLGPGNDMHWVALQHHACGHCKQLHTVSAVDVNITFDRRGKQQVKKKVIVDKLIVTAEEVEQIRALKNAPAAAVPIAPPQTPDSAQA